MMLTVRPLGGVLWKRAVWGEREPTRYCIGPFVSSLKRSLPKRPEQKSCAWFGLLQHIVKRAGTENRPVFNGCLLLFLSFSFALLEWLV